MNQTFQSSANMASQAPPPTQPSSLAGTQSVGQGQQSYQQGQGYSVQGSSAMAPAPMYQQPQQGYPNNVVQFPQQQIPTAPMPSVPTPQPDYTPAMQPGMYQNPPPGMGYSQPVAPQPQPTPSPSTQPSNGQPQEESGWKQAFHSLANMLATPVWGQGGQSSQSPSSAQGQQLDQGWAQQQQAGMQAQGYHQGPMATPTYNGNQGYGQGYSQQQQPQYLPQPGSAEAPLSYIEADPGMPTDEQLAQMGYRASTLNQYATEVEDQLLGLADRHQVLAQKYNASSTILTQPHVLANYVVDFHRHVDPTFLTRVADYHDEMVATVQQQGQPTQQMQAQPAQQYQLGQPGNGPTQLGSGMITPEMMQTHDVIIPNSFNSLTQPMLHGTSQAQAMAQAQQQAAQYPIQQPNAGQRVAAPGMPQHGQQVSSDDIYSGLRQGFAQNPATAWQMLRQVEAQYGPQAIAKPMVTV